MIISKLKNFLEKKKIKYEDVSHKAVFSAKEAAKVCKVKLEEIAKTLIVKNKDKNKYLMVIIPGSKRLDLKKVAKKIKAKEIRLALEDEMKKIIKDADLGATPGVGTLWKLPVYLDKSLKSKEIVFGGGKNTDSVKMKLSDFLKIQKTQKGDFIE